MSENEEIKVNPNEEVTSQSGKKKVNKGAIAIALVIIILLGIIIFLLLKKDAPVSIADDANPRATLVTKDNLEDVKTDLNTAVEDGYYEVSMSIDWDFEDSTKPSSTGFVENVTTNTRTVYFDLITNETNELVYSSPFIPVGATLDGIVLDKQLSAGDYPAVVTYHLVDDNSKELSTVSVAITLHILN